MKPLELSLGITCLASIGLTSCSSGGADVRENKKPNILFIAIDDLKPTLGSYGDSIAITPHMDAIAEGGAIFLNNHCQQAVCGPSRASLLTGMYPDQTGIRGFYPIRDKNPDIVTLPQYFRQNGYYTVNISKIFDQRTVDQYWDSLSWSQLAFPLSEKDLVPWFNKETGPVTTYFYQSPIVKEKFEALKKEALSKGLDTIKYTQQHIKPAMESLDMPDDAYKDGVFARKAIADLEMHTGREILFQFRKFFLYILNNLTGITAIILF